MFVLDLNRAYNPPCAVSDDMAFPTSPLETFSTFVSKRGKGTGNVLTSSGARGTSFGRPIENANKNKVPC